MTVLRSHWIIHLINLFENTDSFLNKTLILSETMFNSVWSWKKKLYKATALLCLKCDYVSYSLLKLQWNGSIAIDSLLPYCAVHQSETLITELQIMDYRKIKKFRAGTWFNASVFDWMLICGFCIIKRWLLACRDGVYNDYIIGEALHTSDILIKHYEVKKKKKESCTDV